MKLFKDLSIFLILCLALVFTEFGFCQNLNKRVVGFFSSWSTGDRDYHVQDIHADKITHINYAFANIDPDAGILVLGDPYADVERFYEGDNWDNDSLRGSFHQLQILKRQNRSLRTLISIGGHNWSVYISDIAATNQARRTFAASCIEFIDRYGFDGIDIDWEYPVVGGIEDNHNRREDRQNFTLLLAELRERLDLHEWLRNRHYILTATVSANPDYVRNLEVNRIHNYVNWLNVMTYDFHGPWFGAADEVTNFNSPLHVAPDDPVGEPFHSSFNVEAGIQQFIDLGAPREKLNIGLAFYGRGYGGVEDQNNGLFVEYAQQAPFGTWEPGSFDYWQLEEIFVNRNNYTRYWHNRAKVPWLYNPDSHIMISYDDEQSIGDKVEFTKNIDVGGVVFWEFSADKHSSLINVVYDHLSDQDVKKYSENYPVLPVVPGLFEVYPNPFNKGVMIFYKILKPILVKIEVFNIKGEFVKTIVDKFHQTGNHDILWDPSGIESGIYFIKFRTPTAIDSHKVVFVK